MINDIEESFPDNPEEPLDELLQAAVWPEPNPASLARLQQQLKQCSSPSKQKNAQHWVMIAIALAAGLLISATIWAFRAGKTETASNIPVNLPKNASPKNEPAPEKQPLTRTPTPYETLLFKVAIDKRKAAIKAMRQQSVERPLEQTAKIEIPPKPNPPNHTTPVRVMLPYADAKTLTRLINKEENPELQEEMFADLLARGDMNSVGVYLDFVSQRGYAERALSILGDMKTPPTEMLFGFLCGAHTPRRLAAALVLGRIDGPETSRKLYLMVRSNVSRQEAMVALLASSGNDASYYVNLAKKDLSLAGILNGASYQYRLLSVIQ
jgi:hypothetical protein